LCRKAFGPDLAIVGEEDPPGEVSKDKRVEEELEAEDVLPADYVIPEELSSLVLADIIIFIDPLDGTREFVEGRLGAVQSLLGVAYRGRAVAGVVGLPFPDGALTEPRLLVGVVGSPSGVLGVPAAPEAGQLELVLALSADRGAGLPSVEAAREEVLGLHPGSRLLPAGACGWAG
jgi:3'(2'), 5'-bisphosphate nucleotidase